MEHKQQVNRIAKNMIEYVYYFFPFLSLVGVVCVHRLLLKFRLTYDARLAELTSLEEMMRSMMDDGQIHQDVIAKLWQVYGSFYTAISHPVPNNFC
jgi:condensin complex subunit 1